MNLLYCFSDSKAEWNSAEWRVVKPVTAINDYSNPPHEARMIDLKEVIQSHPHPSAAWADVLVVQRNALGPVLPVLLTWQAMGKKLVLDLDDNYWLIPPYMNSYILWKQNQMIVDVPNSYRDPFGQTLTKEKIITKPVGYSVIDHLIHSIKAVDLVTVPCEFLASYIRRFTDHVAIVPNYLEPTDLMPKQTATKRGALPIVIGWGGSYSHLQSFKDSGIDTALRRMAEKGVPFKVRIVGEPRIKDVLRLPAGYIETTPRVPFAQWPEQIACFDIGIAPLASDYDRSRSWLKAIEFSLAGIPWAGSDLGDPQPYSDFKSHLVRNKPAAWEERLTDMVVNYDRYNDDACIFEDLNKAASLANIHQGIDRTLETYSKLLNGEIL